MKKRILSMLLVLALVLTMIPASALAETINDDNVFLMQSGSGKCTLTSAVMMLRRRAIIDGNADWESITETTLGSVAWISGTGIRNSYSYMGMDVGVKYFSVTMSTAEKKSSLLALLEEHPEGVEIYDVGLPHAVLLTDYDADTDTFYCADPGTAAKRIKLSQSWNAVNHNNSQDNVIANIGKIWYITNKSGGGPGLLTVKLDPNGGTCSEANAYVTAEGTVKSLPTPTRNGYAFTGWFDAASGGTKITSSYKFTKDTTIYAQWQRVPCIMLDPCGGECDTLYVYATIDGKISSLPTPTMDGFRFLGWYDAPEGGNKVTTSTPVLKDITLYAQWKDTTIRGECGSNLKWSLNEDTGVLRISGSGEMSDYHSADGLESPWHDYAASIKSVVIGSGVKTVGNYAFAGLKNLKSVEINAELKRLGDGAFYGCTALNDIEGIEGVRIIGNECFRGCSALSTIGIPSGCTSVGSYAFAGTAIKSISVPKSVTNIGEGAFSGCKKLSYAELPSGISAVSGSLFSGCTALEAFFVKDDSSYGGSGMTIETNAFYGCTALREVGIYSRADSLRIAKNAFSGCKGLKSVSIDCRSLVLDDNAFPSSAKIDYINISGEYGYVAPNAFQGVSTTVVYPANGTKWGEHKGENYGGSLVWESYDNHVHDYKTTVVTPTCSERGYTIYECKSCNEKFESSYVRQLGHSFVNGECSVCGIKNPFTDIDAQGKHVYYTDAIIWAAENNITSGYTATSFLPDGQCTRGQVVTFLWRLAGQPEPTNSKSGFADVMDNAYYTKAVTWAAERGITTGVDDTHFAPNATVTRAQFVTFLWRYLDRPVYGTFNPFTDVSSSSVFAPAILWAYENGVTAGTTATTFAPGATATRAQVVTFLYRTNNLEK